MYKINILTKYNHNIFIHQLNIDKYKDEFIFYENSQLNIIWDLVVVYENINKEQHLKVIGKNLLFISGEPAINTSYPQGFIKQFMSLITSRKKLKHKNNILMQQAFNWHFGYCINSRSFKYNYNKLISLDPPIKSKNISIITSNLNMLPAHIKRLRLIKILKAKFGDSIDFFGKGMNQIDDKADALLPYRFHICIENDFLDDYWTEKFSDPIIGYSIPIYIGCTNINKYFPEKFYFSFNIEDVKSIITTINLILENSETIYNNNFQSLIEARNKILDEYNIFDVIVRYFCTIEKNKEIKSIKIYPQEKYFSYRFINLKIRLIRFIINKYYNIIYYFENVTKY